MEPTGDASRLPRFAIFWLALPFFAAFSPFSPRLNNYKSLRVEKNEKLAAAKKILAEFFLLLIQKSNRFSRTKRAKSGILVLSSVNWLSLRVFRA